MLQSSVPSAEDKDQLLNVAVHGTDSSKCRSSSSTPTTSTGCGCSCCRPSPATTHLIVIYTLLVIYGLALVALFCPTRFDIRSDVHAPIEQQQQPYVASGNVIGSSSRYSDRNEARSHHSLHGSLITEHALPNIDDDNDKMGRVLSDDTDDFVAATAAAGATGSFVGGVRTKRSADAQTGEIQPIDVEEVPVTGSPFDVTTGDDEQTMVRDSTTTTTNWSVTVEGDRSSDDDDDDDDGGYSLEETHVKNENLSSSPSEDRSPDERRSRSRREKRPAGSGRKKSSTLPAPTSSGQARGRKQARRQKLTQADQSQMSAAGK
jgi:hypothetical protein